MSGSSSPTPKGPRLSWFPGALMTGVLSLIHTWSQAPEGQETMFLYVSLGSGLLGFTTIWAITKWTARQVVTIGSAIVLFVVGYVCFRRFHWLVNSPDETSPTFAISLLEALLFAVWTFGLFSVFGAAYRIGGDPLIEAFQKMRGLGKP